MSNGNKESFVIECPFSKMCPVRVKFSWNKQKGYFSRESSFAIFHDHCVQRIDLDGVDEETIVEARALVRQSNKKITASELAEQCKIKHWEATILIKTTLLTEFYELPDAKWTFISFIYLISKCFFSVQQDHVIVGFGLAAIKGRNASDNGDLQYKG